MEQRQQILIALKKARTSLDKIIARVAAGGAQSQCFDVLQQTLSVIGLLKSANNRILSAHVDAVLARSVGKVLTRRSADALRDEIVRIVQTAQKK